MPRAGPRKSNGTAWSSSARPSSSVSGQVSRCKRWPTPWRSPVHNGAVAQRRARRRAAGRVALPAAVKTPPASQVKRLQALQRKYALLEEEHPLLKNSSGSPPHESRRLRVHRRRAGTVGDAALSAVRGHARRVLCVATPAGECTSEAGLGTPRGDACDLRGNGAPTAVRGLGGRWWGAATASVVGAWHG